MYRPILRSLKLERERQQSGNKKVVNMKTCQTRVGVLMRLFMSLMLLGTYPRTLSVLRSLLKRRFCFLTIQWQRMTKGDFEFEQSC